MGCNPLLLFIFLGAVLFMALIFPIMLIVHCATNKSLGTTGKTIWIVLMVLIFPIAQYLYAFFVSEKMWHKTLAFGAILLGCLAYMAAPQMNPICGLGAQESLRAIRSIEEMPIGDISPEGQRQVKESLQVLKQELASSRTGTRQKMNDILIVQILKGMLSDGQLTVVEYMDWLDKFETRGRASTSELKRYLARYGETP